MRKTSDYDSGLTPMKQGRWEGELNEKTLREESCPNKVAASPVRSSQTACLAEESCDGL